MSAIASRYDGALPYDLVQLRYVRAIAAAGNMTAAARQLRVSQPTLSNVVRNLERRLGTALFLRGPRGVVPTASGQALARAADEVLLRLRQADEELRGIESAVAGHFVVGCHHSLGAIVLPGLMESLAARAPAIELSLWEAIGPRVIDAVLDRTLHFGLDTRSTLSTRKHPELVSVPLFNDVFAVVCARKRPAARAPLFYVPRINLSERLLASLRARKQLPERLVPCGDLELVKSLVLRGVGLGILPWRVALQDTPRGALRLLDPKLPFEVDVGTLFYRADLHRTRAALLLRDELVRCGRALDAVPMPCGVPRIGRRS